MGVQIISGMVLLILTFLLVSNADKWAKPLMDLTPTLRNIITTLQGRPL